MNPEDVKYHKEHTWVRIAGKKATMGITDYAQRSLGDIVYIDLPETDVNTAADTELADIESTKTTSAVISPVSGRILDINEKLVDSPEIINEDAYGKGWIAIIELSIPAELDHLMDADEYEAYVEEEDK